MSTTSLTAYRASCQDFVNGRERHGAGLVGRRARGLTNAETIPTVASDLFSTPGCGEFAVGVVGEGTCAAPGFEREFEGYLRLRGAVYTRQMGMLPADTIAADGTESDEEDARAVHFAVFGRTSQGVRAHAALRGIRKSCGGGGALPVEKLFPEAFADGAAPATAVEISRFISRHEDRAVQTQLKWPLFLAAMAYGMVDGFSPAYGLTRPALADSLAASGLGVTRISQPKLLPAFGGAYVAVKIDMRAAAKVIGRAPGGAAPAGGFTYFDVAPALAAAA